MATYIEVTEAQSNPFAPVTSELIKQLRDNPIAISEGAATALRNQPRSLFPFFLGKLSGSGATATGFTDLDPLTIIRLDVYWTGNITGGGELPEAFSSRNLQMRVSNNNGATWTGWFSFGSRGVGQSFGYLNMFSGVFVGAVNAAVTEPLAAPVNLSIDFATTNLNAFQIRLDNNGEYVATSTYVSRADGA